MTRQKIPPIPHPLLDFDFDFDFDFDCARTRVDFFRTRDMNHILFVHTHTIKYNHNTINNNTRV